MNSRRPGKNGMNLRIISLLVAMIICLAGGLAHVLVRPANDPAGQSAAPEILAARSVTPKNIPAHFQSEVVSMDEWLQRATNAVAASPAEALAIGRKLLADDPADENGRVAILLDALCSAGQFQTALALANEGTALQPDGLKLVFNCWAQSHPQEALKSLDSVADAERHSIAFRALADGWSASNPADLAAYAAALPDSQDRGYGLGVAMDNWSLQDPAGLATWLNQQPPGIEFDAGAAMMIEKTDGANRSPELAMKWVEHITDPELKQNSFLRVLAEWKQTDMTAAQKYVDNAPWLNGTAPASPNE